jgi:membrane protease YdiL (CAAX protease family)
VLFGVVRVHGPDASLREVLGIDESPLALPPAVRPHAVASHRIGVVVACLVAGVALVALDGAFDDAFMARDGSLRDEIQRIGELLAAPTLQARVVRFVGLGVAQPLAELAFYFGIVFGGLRRPRSRFLAGAMALLFFALHASDLRALPIRVLLGATLLVSRMATGTIAASAVTSVAFSAIEVAQIGRSEPIVGGSVVVWAQVFSVALAALVFLARLASRWRLGEFADRLDLRA